MPQWPTGKARPCAASARARSRPAAPGPASAKRAPASTSTCFSAERSSAIPSCSAMPDQWCPPPRAETASPWSRAKRTAACTSRTEAARTMASGRRGGWRAFHSSASQAAAWRASASGMTAPETDRRSVSRSMAGTFLPCFLLAARC